VCERERARERERESQRERYVYRERDRESTDEHDCSVHIKTILDVWEVGEWREK